MRSSPAPAPAPQPASRKPFLPNKPMPEQKDMKMKKRAATPATSRTGRPPLLDPNLVPVVREMLALGWSPREIGLRLNCSHFAVTNFIQRHGLKTWREQSRERYEALIAAAGGK